MNKEQTVRRQYGGMSLASWLLAMGQLAILVVVANVRTGPPLAALEPVLRRWPAARR